MAIKKLESLNNAIKLNALALADATNNSEIDTYYSAIEQLMRNRVHLLCCLNEQGKQMAPTCAQKKARPCTTTNRQG